MFKTKKKSKKGKEGVKETVALSQPGAFEPIISMMSDVGCVRELNETPEGLFNLPTLRYFSAKVFSSWWRMEWADIPRAK
jgi:hypothetical protein